MHGCRAAFLITCLLASSSAHAGSAIPQFQWAVQPLVGTGQSSAHGLVMDHSGNTFVCGQFTDTLNFLTETLRATGNTVPQNTEVFLVKYATNGDVLWARNGGNSTLGSNEVGYAVAVDPAGNPYMTGEYSGASATSFDGIEIDDTGGGAFAVKYNSGGTVQWATSVSTAGVGNGIATSGLSFVYVFVGAFPTSSVFKLNAADGSVADTWNFTGLMPDQVMKISVDGSGNVIISGSFTGTVDFDPGGPVSNLVADGFTDGFIAKYTSTGAPVWARQLTSTGADAVTNHALAAAGDVYFSGVLENAGTIGVATADPGQVVGRLDADGNAQWMRNTTSDLSGTPLDLYADGIGVDGNGDYYIFGVGLPNGGTIGSFTIPGVNHFHIVRYSPAGAVVYAKFVTTAGSILLPQAISVTGTDLYNVVGGMVDECVFDSHTLPDINGSPRQAAFSAQVGDVTVPVLASLATAEASPDRVRLKWYVSGLDGAVFVERRRGAEEWLVVGEAVPSGSDYVGYEDHDVTPGDRLTYRLLWNEGGEALHSSPVEILVPRLIEGLALAAAPNPASASLDALIAVPASGEALLAMHDILGRQVMERRVEASAAGRMIVRLGTSELPAGLYWLSLRHGGGVARTRVSIVR
jgi:hypothetical protein